MKTKQFEINTKGRDFVVGDLHGCINLFQDALKAINFLPDRDRMFSVGDLGDRGPDSPACMELMFKTWFHAVRSNHGDLMNGYLEGNPISLYNWVPNGGNWLDEVDSATLLKFTEADKALPFILTVNMTNGKKFHVIHAEFSTRAPLTDEILASQEISFINKVDKASLEQSRDGPLITWGRLIFRQFFGNHLAEEWKDTDNIFPQDHINFFNSHLSHIYSGHTVMVGPTRYLGQTNIDTGAVFCAQADSLGLTITEPLTDRFWKTNTKGTTEVKVITVA